MKMQLEVLEAGLSAIVKLNDLAEAYEIDKIIMYKGGVSRIDRNIDGTKVYLRDGDDVTFNLGIVSEISGIVPTSENDLFDRINVLIAQNLV